MEGFFYFVPMVYFNYNGKLYPGDTAIIGPRNRGLCYGDGLFETIKLKDGKACFWNDHVSRLWHGLRILQFDLPSTFTPNLLSEQILALIERNNHYSLARIRLNVFRGNGSLSDPENNFPNYTIQTFELIDEVWKLPQKGLVMEIFKPVQKSCDILSNLKHNNYLPNAMAAFYAKKGNCDDAVMLNMHQRICETSIANIFLVKDQMLSTPQLSEGCVDGVMRKNLINRMRQSGIEINEKPITQEELLNADEIFITNVIKNVQWVRRIGEKEFGSNFINHLFEHTDFDFF